MSVDTSIVVRQALAAHPKRSYYSGELGAWVWRHDRADGDAESFCGPTPHAAVQACIALRGRP